MSVNALLVTDDELVAWMTEGGDRAYAPVLPTIDVTSPDSLSGAAMRGIRSIAVREDADGIEITAQLDRLLSGCADAAPVMLMNIDFANPEEFRGPAASIVPKGVGVVVDLVDPTGVHRLWESSFDELAVFVQDAVARVVEVSAGSTSLVLFTGLVGEYETFAADGRGVRSASVSVDGDGAPTFAIGGGAVSVVDTLREMSARAWSARV